MKRLILMGGRPWFAEDGGKKFVDVLFRYHPKEVKLAFCLFAKPEDQWEGSREVNFSMIGMFKGERTVEHQTLTRDNFAGVSAWADVIYIPGGSTVPVEEIEACGDIRTLWDGKVIAGSSAGADLFCGGYISLEHNTFGRGLGWVDATFIPHWRSTYAGYTDKTDEDWRGFEQKALRNAPDLPVLCVQETEFVEFTVS